MKNRWNEENLKTICKDAYSIKDALEQLGLCPVGGGNVFTFKKYVKKYNIDISHFTGQRWRINPKNIQRYMEWRKTRPPRYSSSEIFRKHSPITRSSLKRKIINHNIIPYICSICGCNGTWMGKHISLEIDHINGINDDNRLENLRFLCPNCHATTDTYCGKNIEKWKENKKKI